MPSFVLTTRPEWGARPEEGHRLFRAARVKGLCLHYSASRADLVERHMDCARRVRAIQTYHMDGRDYADIAYNFLVCRHGGVFEGRGWNKQSAAQACSNGSSSANTSHLAICYLGHDARNTTEFSDAAKRAILAIRRDWLARHPNASEVKCHSDFCRTSCPGDEIRTWVRGGMRPPTNP